VRFRDRTDAGRRLAELLAPMPWTHPIVLALPRGGVPVAAQVASALGAPLEVFVACKVGARWQPELGVAAVTEGGVVVAAQGAPPLSSEDARDPDGPVARALAEAERRVERYRGSRALPDLHGRDVILVDDGLATGVTAHAALLDLRRREPRRLVLAVPVAARSTVDWIATRADSLVCVATPQGFGAVGAFYDRFDQTSDDEVLALLDAGRGDA
jgi:putative phosphoribosyl transferase